MYFVTLASAFNMEPPSSRNPRRTLLVTTFFATAAIVGWPFALALSIPFVVEELFLYAGDIVPAADKSKWVVTRWLRFARSVATAALIFVSLIQSTALRLIDLFAMKSGSGRGNRLPRLWKTHGHPVEHYQIQHLLRSIW